jgi:hypothetical protein
VRQDQCPVAKPTRSPSITHSDEYSLVCRYARCGRRRGRATPGPTAAIAATSLREGGGSHPECAAGRGSGHGSAPPAEKRKTPRVARRQRTSVTLTGPKPPRQSHPRRLLSGDSRSSADTPLRSRRPCRAQTTPRHDMLDTCLQSAVTRRGGAQNGRPSHCGSGQSVRSDQQPLVVRGQLLVVRC